MTNSQWFLEFHQNPDHHHNTHRIALQSFPFMVGRGQHCALTIPCLDVSRQHAEFSLQDHQVFLEDFYSTNGSYLNHQKVTGKVKLKHGDILHFANMEYRLIEKVAEEDQHLHQTCNETVVGIESLSSILQQGLFEFRELLKLSQVKAILEPIVTTHKHEIYGYESLGRGCHPELSDRPLALFELAESDTKEVELSELFRIEGAKVSLARKNKQPLFVNTHPSELNNTKQLLKSIEKLLSCYPQIDLVLEIHEEAIASLAKMKSLQKTLKSYQVRLAYDDFGSGQTRLIELVQSPPDFIKFDICLIKNINQAPLSQIKIIKTLLEISQDNGVTTIAEGVSDFNKVRSCEKLGFDLMQGYYFPSQLS